MRDRRAREAHRGPLARRGQLRPRQQRRLPDVPRGGARRVAPAAAAAGRPGLGPRRRPPLAALPPRVVPPVSIAFRREVTQADDEVTATCAIERIGTSSVRTREQVVLQSGVVAAEASAVLVARDRSTGRSRPIAAPERESFERDLAGSPAPAPAD